MSDYLNFANSLAQETSAMTDDIANINLSDAPQPQPIANQKIQKIQKNVENDKKQKKSFIHGNNVMLIRGSYKGYLGFVYEFVPAKYELDINGKNIMFLKNAIEKRRDSYLVTRGPFKSDTGSLVHYHPANLTIYIDAIYKKVSNHYIMVNGQSSLKPITPDDVFYFDIELKDRKMAEISRIVDGVMYGTVQGTTNEIIINKDDILSFQPGFKILEDNEQAIVQDDSDTFSSDEKDAEEDLDDVDDIDNIHSDTRGAVNELRDVTENETEYTSTFKDQDRLTYERSHLSSREAQIRTRVVKVLNLYNVNESEVQIFDLIENINTAFERTQAALNSLVQYRNKWVKSDEKLIIACLVFYEIIKNGLSYVFSDADDAIRGYVKKLLDSKFLLERDAQKSLFIRGGWMGINQNMETDILAAFKNCTEFLKRVLELPHIDLEKLIAENKYATDDIIPITRKNHLVKKFITIGELAKMTTGGVWSQEDFLERSSGAKKILWGPQYVGIIEKFKTALRNKVKEASKSNKKSTQIVYSYILEHLDQAPFYIKTTSQLSTMEKKINDKLQETWNILMQNYIIPFYNTNRTISDNKKEKIQNDRKHMIDMHHQDMDIDEI